MNLLDQFSALVARLLPRASFARSVGVLAGGTASSQILLIVAAPILTRLYNPEAFGMLAIYLAMLAFVAVNASFRYEMAVPLAENDQDAIYLVTISLALVALTSISTAILVGCLGETIANELNVPKISQYLWLLPVGVMCIGSYQVFNAFAIRQRAFQTIALTRFTQSAAVLALQICSYKLGAISLIGGQAIGQGAGSISLGRTVLAAIKSADRMSLAGAVNVARKYRRFPIFSSWAAFFNTIGTQLPVVMIAAMFGPLTAGFFSLAYRVLTAPITMIGAAIGNVFLSNVASAHREGKLAQKLDTVHQKLVHLIMPFMLLLALFGPEFFALIFGKEWEEAGVFARWMTPWLYMVFITSPLSSTFEAMGKQHHNLLFQATLLLVRIGAIVIGAKMNSIQIALIGFSIGSALCWAFFLAKAFANVELSFWRIVQPTAVALLWAALCTLPLIAASALELKSIYIITCAVLSIILCSFRLYSVLLKRPTPQIS